MKHENKVKGTKAYGTKKIKELEEQFSYLRGFMAKQLIATKKRNFLSIPTLGAFFLPGFDID